MDRVVEIAGEKRSLRLYRGFMVVESEGREMGRVPLDDMAALIVHGFGITWSNNLLVALAERKVPVVICDTSLNPAGLMWPIVGHHKQAERMDAQVAATKPCNNRIWKSLIQAKVANQARVLELTGCNASPVARLVRKVQSGDKGNVESQAARLYFSLLFGSGFRRDRTMEGINALLNYGYMVMRAATARAVMYAGLHPSFPIHHKNVNNPMRLVDDLLEPFRPVVDIAVCELIRLGAETVDVKVKRALAGCLQVDMEDGRKVSPAANALKSLATSVAMVYLKERTDVELPGKPTLPDMERLYSGLASEGE